MRAFILFWFWLSVVGGLCKVLTVMGADYPRRETFSLGEDILRVIESIVIAMIAGFLLWGR